MFEIDGNQTHESGRGLEIPHLRGRRGEDAPRRHLRTRGTATLYRHSLDNTTGWSGRHRGRGRTTRRTRPAGRSGRAGPWTDTGNATGKSDYGRVAAYSYVKQVNGARPRLPGPRIRPWFERWRATATSNYYFEAWTRSRARTATTSNPNPNPQRRATSASTINDQGSGVFSAPDVEKWTAVDCDALVRGARRPASNPSYDVKANKHSVSINDLASWWTSVQRPQRHHPIRRASSRLALDLTSFGAVLGCPSTGFSTLNGRSSTGASDKNLVDYFKGNADQRPVELRLAVHQEGSGLTAPHRSAAPPSGSRPNPLPVGTPGRPSDSLPNDFRRQQRQHRQGGVDQLRRPRRHRRPDLARCGRPGRPVHR